MLQLQTLGTLDLLTADGTPVDSLLVHPRTAALLVALVLVRPRGFQRRDTLCAMFWPDSDDAHARGALSQALSRLRREVGADTIEVRGADEVRVVDGAIECDALAFEDAVERGDHVTAMSLYHGTLLPGFHLRGADGFEEWLEEERARLRILAAGSSRGLVRRLLASGRFTEAETTALLALDLEPVSELLMLELVQALVGRGDAIGAVRIFEGWSARLQRELQVAPSPEFSSMIRELREEAPPTSAPPMPRKASPAAAPDQADEAAPPLTMDPPQPEPGSHAGSGDAADRHEHRRRWRNAAGRMASVGVLGAVVAGVFLFMAMWPPAPVPLENRVAVLPFDNRTGDASLDPLGPMSADWVIRGLTQLPSLEIVPAEVMRLELDTAPGARRGTVESAREVGRATRAGTVVGGAYYRQGDSIWFHPRFIDTASGRLLPAPDPVGTQRDLPLQGVEALLHAVAGALIHRRMPAMAGFAELLDQRPPSYAAYSAYLEGAELFMANDWEGSITRFLAAHRADSTYLTPLLSAATAATHLRRPATADSLLAIVAPARARLAPNDAFFFDYLRADLRGDRAGKLRLARVQLARYPGAGYEYVTALSELGMNHPAEAAALLETLRGQDLYRRVRGVWTNLAWAHHACGDHRAELRTADAARDRFPSEAWAVALQVRALGALGRHRALGQRLDEIEAMGSPGSPSIATLFREAARELELHGHRDEAERVRERALRWLRSRPLEERALPAFRLSEAWALFDLGHAVAARTLVQPLVREQPGDPELVAFSGMVAASVGDAAAVARAQAELSRIGAADPYSRGRHQRLLAFVAAQQYDASGAVRLLHEAFSLGDAPDAALHRALCGELRPIRNDTALRALLGASR
jgi:DNA-binding SARP family transcriptional activator/TolB-like protein/tetratricopeptide (TPR) repeat protein